MILKYMKANTQQKKKQNCTMKKIVFKSLGGHFMAGERKVKQRK